MGYGGANARLRARSLSLGRRRTERHDATPRFSDPNGIGVAAPAAFARWYPPEQQC